MEKHVGPKLRIVASCLCCDYEHSERYQVQGDSGNNVFCTHPAKRRYIGDSTWDTPEWCPFLAASRIQMAREIEASPRQTSGALASALGAERARLARVREAARAYQKAREDPKADAFRAALDAAAAALDTLDDGASGEAST